MEAILQYGSNTVTAPAAYHLALAYSTISALIHPDFANRAIFPTRPLIQPYWLMLVGESGCGKSLALAVARDLGEAVWPGMYQPEPVSEKGLLRSLTEQPHQTQQFSDMGAFLTRTAQKAGPAAEIRPRLLEIHDGITVALRAGNEDEARIMIAPRLTLQGGVTPAQIDANLDQEAHAGGFTARWTVTVASPEHYCPPGRVWPEMRGRIVETLQEIHQTAWGDCVGLDAGARERFVRADLAVAKASTVASGEAGAVYTRVRVAAIRHAVVAAIVLGEARTDPWILSARAFQYGLNAAQVLHLNGLRWMMSVLAQTAYQRNRRRLLAFLLAADKGARLLSEIHREMRMPAKSLNEVIEGLQHEGRVTQEIGTAGIWIQAVPETTVLARDAARVRGGEGS